MHVVRRDIFRLFSKIEIPDEWIDEFAMPTEREWDAMIDPKNDCSTLSWANVKASDRDGNTVCHPCVHSCSTSRILPISAYWNNPARNGNRLKLTTILSSKMFFLLCDSHNFYGKAASLVEQTAIRLKHDTFIWIRSKDLQQFKLRWDKLIKELLRVGIDDVMLPPKNRFLQFVSALKVYGHSTVVQMQCIVRPQKCTQI